MINQTFCVVVDWYTSIVPEILMLWITAVFYRYHKLLLYLGISTMACKDLKAQTFCKILAEFALEYKITREKIILQEAINAKKAKEKQRQQQIKKKIVVDVRKIILNFVCVLLEGYLFCHYYKQMMSLQCIHLVWLVFTHFTWKLTAMRRQRLCLYFVD